jgi:hypothetical protein
VRAIIVATTLGVAASTPAYAQNGEPPPRIPTPTEINSEISAASQVLNLGSNFLERLGNQATNGYGFVLRNNPAGGGASAATEAPPYRSWGEVYGISVTTGPQGDFFGDRRRIVGGVAGFGARIAPGVNIGFSIDQSYTAIDVPLALQTATIDLTQFGFNASVDKGSWTWALALVHGTGNIGSRRDTIFGPATAGYGTQLDGALTELAYFVDLKQGSRIVPKVDLEYVRATTGAFQEMGGLDPVAASGAALERARVLVGAEVGHYWIFDRKDSGSFGLRQIRRQFFAKLQFSACQLRATGHRRPGNRRKPVWRRRRRLRFTLPEQHRTCLSQLRRQVPFRAAVASGNPRRGSQMVARRLSRAHNGCAAA